MTSQLSTKVNDDLLSAVREQAKNRGMRLTEAIDEALRSWLPAPVAKKLPEKRQPGRPKKGD